MSYHIYTTLGIVLKKTNFDEANSLFYILTEDLGLILASAQGVRLSNSKLKGSLQEFSLINLSCVKGKGGWRITNAIYQNNFFFDTLPEKQNILAKISKTLIRMMPGEEKSSEVFSIVSNCFSGISLVAREKLESFEIVSILKILYFLGYVDKNEKTESFLDLQKDIINQLEFSDSDKKVLIGLVNKGLKESHL